MKIFFTPLILCFSLSAFGQSEFKINLISSLEHNFSKFSHTYNFPYSDEPYMKSHRPIGYSLGVALEFSIGEEISISTGLSNTQKNFYPERDFGLWYGAVFQQGNDYTYLPPPYLYRNQFKVIELPVLLKKYFGRSSKVKGFFLGGGSIGFQYQASEWYAPFMDFNIDDDEAILRVDVVDNNVKHFNTALICGAGLQVQILPKLHLLLEGRTNVFEIRRTNENIQKFTDNLWEDQFLPLSQVSVGVGLQYSM